MLPAAPGSNPSGRTRRQNSRIRCWNFLAPAGDHCQNSLAGHVLPASRGLHAIRAWTGLNPQLDGAPLLGETPGIPGLFHAVTSNGYTLGPVAGRLVAEAVLGRGKVPAAFALDRFG